MLTAREAFLGAGIRKKPPKIDIQEVAQPL